MEGIVVNNMSIYMTELFEFFTIDRNFFLFVVGHPMLSVGQQPTSKPYLLFTRTGLTELSGILFLKYHASTG